MRTSQEFEKWRQFLAECQREKHTAECVRNGADKFKQMREKWRKEGVPRPMLKNRLG